MDLADAFEKVIELAKVGMQLKPPGESMRVEKEAIDTVENFVVNHLGDD